MKIVFTGGPSAGKTTIAEIVARNYRQTCALVPESASILFRGGWPRSTHGEVVKNQQIAIYHVQSQLEKIIEIGNPGKHFLCDRGTLDGMAYWPGPGEMFLQAVGATQKEELAKYDWVIELGTAQPAFYAVNSLRIESPEEAQQISQRINEVWKSHPRHILITNSVDFETKISRVLGVMHRIFAGEDAETIRQALHKGLKL